ncbi:MAG: hypothetical protein HC880_18545, partial [Bacteroidia bacterium]|nr:hypothetical protein [Bacteroidia bacterium]
MTPAEPLFIESIQICEGIPQNLLYHQQRLDATRCTFFGPEAPALILDDWVQVPLPYHKGLVKCRMVYGREVEDVCYQPYVLRPIRSLRLSHSSFIRYDYKNLNRNEINFLYAQKGDADDVLIVRGGGRIT